jgi:hypothetical protein
MFVSITDDSQGRCWWENYEEILAQYCELLKKKEKRVPLLQSAAISLACWEILLYCYDSCVSELNFNYQEAFHRVLNKQISVDERMVFLNNSLSLLNNLVCSSSNAKYLLQGWNMLQEYTAAKNYAVWLAKLIGE